MEAEGFWANPERARADVKRMKHARTIVDPLESLAKRFGDVDALVEMTAGLDDPDLEKELLTSLDAIARELENIEFRVMLGGEHDHRSCFLSVQAGAGGTEACDWASMLTRMYLRWCERNGYKVEEVDSTPGDEAGIRWITLQVTGDYAYGYLKAEIGVHRLVRISPFDANKRRHTSFAAVDVSPLFEDEEPTEIKDSDLEVDTMRSGGAGGQHVNKTESAIRIRHVPSGIVVKCQSQRSQHKNRALAMQLIAAKLAQIKEAERDSKVKQLYGEKGEISFGSQIRSYVLAPYQLVKDHRTNYDSTNPGAVLEGDIDGFMREYLRQRILKPKDSGKPAPAAMPDVD
ncbi:MAG: peptide chain release factor 2 [Planctomycetes bacterium]|nr:peptide chain release factor 2 [Planctomycetota bacterium]